MLYTDKKAVYNTEYGKHRNVNKSCLRQLLVGGKARREGQLNGRTGWQTGSWKQAGLTAGGRGRCRWQLVQRDGAQVDLCKHRESARHKGQGTTDNNNDSSKCTERR